MDRLGPYVDLRPALGRIDAFFATRHFAADEPYAELLVIPKVDQDRIPLATRLHHALRSQFVLKLSEVGVDSGQYFWAVTLGPLHAPLEISRIAPPVAATFWSDLASCLADLHSLGVFHCGLSEDTVAISSAGRPALFDFLHARQPSDPRRAEQLARQDIVDFMALAERTGAAELAHAVGSALPSAASELVTILREGHGA
jgi:serine/threonine protein kinase